MSLEAKLVRHAQKINGATERAQTAVSHVVDTVLEAGMLGQLSPARVRAAVAELESIQHDQLDTINRIYALFESLDIAAHSAPASAVLPTIVAPMRRGQSGFRMAAVKARR